MKYIIGTSIIFYLVVAELMWWGHTHQWHSAFLDGNGLVILTIGWIPIFILIILWSE